MSRTVRFALVFAGLSILIIATFWMPQCAAPMPIPTPTFEPTSTPAPLLTPEPTPMPRVSLMKKLPSLVRTLESVVEEWVMHLLGLGGEAIGVFISLWLTRAAGLLPRRARKQIAGISLAIAVVSYAMSQAALSEVTSSPQFFFQNIKDGFSWSTSLPLFAKAFGQVDD
jgi:hypothetical protein